MKPVSATTWCLVLSAAGLVASALGAGCGGESPSGSSKALEVVPASAGTTQLTGGVIAWEVHDQGKFLGVNGNGRTLAEFQIARLNDQSVRIKAISPSRGELHTKADKTVLQNTLDERTTSIFFSFVNDLARAGTSGALPYDTCLDGLVHDGDTCDRTCGGSTICSIACTILAVADYMSCLYHGAS